MAARKGRKKASSKPSARSAVAKRKPKAKKGSAVGGKPPPNRAARREGKGKTLARSKKKSTHSAGKRKVSRVAQAVEQKRLAAAARQRFEAQQRRSAPARARKLSLQQSEDLKRRFAAIEEIEASEIQARLREKFDAARRVRIQEITSKLASLRRQFERADPRKLTGAEYQHLANRVTAAEQDLKYAYSPPPIDVARETIAIGKEITLGKELLDIHLLDFYRQAEAEGKVQRISRKHQPGKIWRVNNEYRSGFVVDRKVGKPLAEVNLEDIVRRMLRAAEKVRQRFPHGKLRISFSFMEYGVNHPKSAITLGTDKHGTFYQSFESTRSLGDVSDVAGLEPKIRQILEVRLREAQGKNSIVLIGFQAKAFEERTEEGKKEFLRERYRIRSAATKTFVSSIDNGHKHTLRVDTRKRAQTQTLKTSFVAGHFHSVTVPPMNFTARVTTEVANGHTHSFVIKV